MKFLLIMTFLCCGYLFSNAQNSDLGLPWSFSNQGSVVDNVFITPRPDYETAAIEDAKNNDLAYRIGLIVAVNHEFLKVSSFQNTANGKIAKMTYHIPEAKGIDVYFTNFYLPQGVTLYVYNKNKKQIVSYNHMNNLETGLYATEIIQGNEVTLELNIENGVDLQNIKLAIGNLGGNYRGGLVASLNNQYDTYDNAIEPLAADPCHINSQCPQGDGFRDVQKTAMHLNYSQPGGTYVCSGNMINNTSGDCTPYVLTASHCEGTLAMNDASYSTWKFVFNYENLTCTSPLEFNKKTITGAKFKARSLHEIGEVLRLNGDFLLLEIIDPTNQLGTTIKPYLGGWDRKSTTSLSEKLISFHHPDGDPKKLTIYKFMQPTGSFNSGGVNTHWACAFEQGGSQGGSSGSNIFSTLNKRIRGTLSGGVRYDNACDTASERRALYSKFHLNWDYTAGDGTSSQRLKDWLDPGALNLTSVNTVEYTTLATNCGILSVNEVNNFDDLINIFPNPSNGQLLTLTVNNNKIKNLNIEIFDVAGKKCNEYQINAIINSQIKLTSLNLSSGVYFVKMHNDDGYTTKKLIVK